MVDYSEIDLNVELPELEDYDGEWINLLFTIDGKCYRGGLSYPSEEAALQGVIETEEFINTRLKVRIRTADGIVESPNYSHSIPTPKL